MAYSLLQSLHEIHNYSQKPTFANKNTIVEELAGMVTTFYHRFHCPGISKDVKLGLVPQQSDGQVMVKDAGTVPGRCRDGAGTVQMPSYQGVNDY